MGNKNNLEGVVTMPGAPEPPVFDEPTDDYDEAVPTSEISCSKPEGPRLVIGDRAVLSEGDKAGIVLERIKEHEIAQTNDECLLFEHQTLGEYDMAGVVSERINKRSWLINLYIENYNNQFGGNENG